MTTFTTETEIGKFDTKIMQSTLWMKSVGNKLIFFPSFPPKTVFDISFNSSLAWNAKPYKKKYFKMFSAEMFNLAYYKNQALYKKSIQKILFFWCCGLMSNHNLCKITKPRTCFFLQKQRCLPPFWCLNVLHIQRTFILTNEIPREITQKV